MKPTHKVLAALALTLGAAVQAQAAADFPKAGPISLVVGFPAGGGADTVARYVAQQLSKSWDVPVVVENRAGAGGILSASYVARAPNNGSTILLAGTNMVQLKASMHELPFDIAKALTPVAQVARSGTLFVAPNSLPANNFKEFVDLVKSQPGRHSFGSYGVGTSSQMYGELLNREAGLDLLHIAYKGAMQAISQGIQGNSVSVAVVDAGSGTPFVRSGQIKALAVTGTERLTTLPDIPTTNELNIKSMDTYGWYGMFVPDGTPDTVVDKINATMREIAATPEYQQRMVDMGLMKPNLYTARQFQQVFNEDTAYWDKVIDDTGVGKSR